MSHLKNYIIFLFCLLFALCTYRYFNNTLEKYTVSGIVTHGYGIEHTQGFPTANLTLSKVPKDWNNDVATAPTMYICNSDYGVGVLWKLDGHHDKGMVYFIDLPHHSNLYGKNIKLRNVRAFSCHRESEFVKYICENYCGNVR